MLFYRIAILFSFACALTSVIYTLTLPDLFLRGLLATFPFLLINIFLAYVVVRKVMGKISGRVSEHFPIVKMAVASILLADLIFVATNAVMIRSTLITYSRGDEIVKFLENFRAKNGRYPKDLVELAGSGVQVMEPVYPGSAFSVDQGTVTWNSSTTTRCSRSATTGWVCGNY